ncbi:MAG: diguanylate cyclase, partial [Candidatus Electrothrix sp. AR4]|nr:diguanylate cyclase [Candidatus Electrothrix sp. AR4]
AENKEISFQLTFTVTDIQAPELSIEPFRRLAHLITIQKTAPESFSVTLKPLGKEKSIPPGYSGPGIIFCEEKLMSWGTITISREKLQENKKQPDPTLKDEVTEKDPAAIWTDPASKNINILRQELSDYKAQLHQVKTTSFRMQKELSIRRQVMDSQNCGILFINLEQRIIYANPIFLNRAGYSLKAIQTKRIDQVIILANSDLNLKEVMKEAMQEGEWQGKAFLKEAMRQGNWQGTTTAGKISEDQESKPSTISFKYTHGNEEGHEKGFVCLLHQKDTGGGISSTLRQSSIPAATQQANHLSTELSYDALTGLADRPSFQQYLEDSIHSAEDDSGKIGLIYVDLDHFKRINQIFGPGFGDKILCSVATILQQCGQEAGADLVARLSGDEFAIILPPPSDREPAEKLAGEIMQRFRTPVNNESRAILIRPSIGYTVYPDDGETPLDLLRNADTAMEAAKGAGGNRITSWNNSKKVQAAQSLYLENDLRHAVAEDN